MIVDILVFLLVLSLVVLIHELGHFLAAKYIGVSVDEFGIGLPPRAKKLFKWKETLFSLNWLPIGGFVRLRGEEVDPLVVGDDVFFRKPILSRLLVLVAGVIGNFILGVVLFGIVYSVLGIPTQTERVKIVEVASGSPADEVGLAVGDVVVRLNDTKVDSLSMFVELVNQHKGERVELAVDNNEKERVVKVMPRVNPPGGEGALGVGLSDVEMVKYPLWQMPFRGVVVGVGESLSWGKEIVSGLWRMVSGIFAGQGVPADLAGPVGIYQLSSSVYKIGVLPFLQFVAVLSINLAVLNILPFPALDGGRVAFLFLEKILGKKFRDRFEGTVHLWGMVILLGLMILITIRDVSRMVGR